MPSRDQILGKLGSALKKGNISPSTPEEIDARLNRHAKNTVPVRSDGDNETQTAAFIAEAERVNATTERLESLDDRGEALMRYLAGHNLPGNLKVAPHPLLEDVDWSKHPTLEIEEGPANGDDQVGLVVAETGVAETGTLVLHSGPESPTTLNFLPDNHIVVIPQSKITGAYEDAWAMLRNAQNGMPRTVNWVTGPSRSAEMEQTLLLGALGPGGLHTLI